MKIKKSNEIDYKELAKEVHIERDSGRINVTYTHPKTGRKSFLFQVSYRGDPFCCGSLNLGDVSSIATFLAGKNNQPASILEVIKILRYDILEEFETPGRTLLYTHQISSAFPKKIFDCLGFTEAASFTNPNTNNEVSLLVYDLKLPSEEEDDDIFDDD